MSSAALLVRAEVVRLVPLGEVRDGWVREMAVASTELVAGLTAALLLLRNFFPNYARGSMEVSTTCGKSR